jgi:hypothetical protein
MHLKSYSRKTNFLHTVQYTGGPLCSVEIRFEMYSLFHSKKQQLQSQNTMSNGIEMVCEMASGDSDWSVSFPPPNWNGIL